MGIISGGNIIEGSGLGGQLQNAGVPVAGTDEVQTITVTQTGAGTYKLSFQGQQTAAIAQDATAAAVDAALEALATVGAGNVAVTGAAGGPYTVTFGGELGKQQVGPITAGSFTGLVSAVAIVETTAGVNATGRGNGKGALLTDTTNGILYINTGTAQAPTWTKVGTQT